MKIPVPVLSVAVTAAVAVTACSTPPVVRDVGPSPSPTSARSALQQYERERIAAEKRAMEANAAAGLPPAVDRGLAEAGAKDGVPFAFTAAGCSYLRLPDRSLWSLESGGALTRGTDLEETLAEWRGALPGCAPSAGVEHEVPVDLDHAAASAANAAGRPYRWRESCRSYVLVAGVKFAVPETLTARGEVLSSKGVDIGCDSGVERPGNDALVLPGQTPAPTSPGGV